MMIDWQTVHDQFPINKRLTWLTAFYGQAASVFPIVVGRVAQSAGGRAIGVINSARIGAAFVGPVIATSLLAWTSVSAVYAALAVMGLACVPLAARPRVVGRPPGGV